jgi:sortase (surface protein transpeptidase)
VVATRIAIPSLKIDLPVIKPGAGYPLCNVAMYIQEISQPREAGVTLIYAHARTGMFLPLLERSRINNGASLIGATIRVWTSNDLVSTYMITKVRRHVTTLDGIFGVGTEQLWIQTSEGPRGTVGKLIVVAKRTGYEAADHEAAHPTPLPVVCH